MVHQVRSQACLPRTLYPWRQAVRRWNRWDGVSLAKPASASQQVMLAGTTSTSQNHTELKVNSPLTVQAKEYYVQKPGYMFHARSKNTDNCGGLTQSKRKSLFVSRVLHDKVSRSGRQKQECCYLLEGFGFPMCRADNIYRKGKNGRV